MKVVRFSPTNLFYVSLILRPRHRPHESREEVLPPLHDLSPIHPPMTQYWSDKSPSSSGPGSPEPCDKWGAFILSRAILMYLKVIMLFKRHKNIYLTTYVNLYVYKTKMPTLQKVHMIKRKHNQQIRKVAYVRRGIAAGHGNKGNKQILHSVLQSLRMVINQVVLIQQLNEQNNETVSEQCFILPNTTQSSRSAEAQNVLEREGLMVPGLGWWRGVAANLGTSCELIFACFLVSG